MKKYACFLILILPPLIAQDLAEKITAPEYGEDIFIGKGYVGAVEKDRINFEEMWLSIPNLKLRTAKSLAIVNEIEQPLSYEKLTAPFWAEVIYDYSGNEKILLKIKVLKQYRYDEEGFIKE